MTIKIIPSHNQKIDPISDCDLTMLFNRKVPCPDIRPPAWPMKLLQSAKTSFHKRTNGQIVLTIEHEVLRDITPKMLEWWFQHLGESMEFAGEVYPRYLVWHPVDHIHWEMVRSGPNGSIGKGAYFRIVEAFGAQSKHHIDSIQYVEKCDEEGLSLIKCVLGIEVFRLEHRFTQVTGGTRYDSRMVVGSRVLFLGWIFNRLIRPFLFSDEKAQAWLQHNIEEVGNLEIFLPELYLAHN